MSFIDREAAVLTALADDPKLLKHPDNIPYWILHSAMISTGYAVKPERETIIRNIEQTIRDTENEWRELLSLNDGKDPNEVIDKLAGNLGFIDWMQAANDWKTVKIQYDALKPPDGEIKRIYSNAGPVGMADIIASNSHLYRRAHLMTLDDWNKATADGLEIKDRDGNLERLTIYY